MNGIWTHWSKQKKFSVGFIIMGFANLQQSQKEKQLSECLHEKEPPISSLKKKPYLAIARCLLPCLYTHSLVGKNTF